MGCITVTTGNVGPTLKASAEGISATVSASVGSDFRFSTEPMGGMSVSVVYVPIVATASVERADVSTTKVNDSIRASVEYDETLRVSVEDIDTSFGASVSNEEGATVSVGCSPVSVSVSLVCTASVSESLEMWWCDNWKVLWDNGIKALWRKGLQ